MEIFDYKRETRKIFVKDDWYPCYSGGYVVLSIVQTHFQEDYWCKVSAWGADDTGVELEYHGSPTAVKGMYEHWKKYIYNRVPDGITREWFFEHGFYYA